MNTQTCPDCGREPHNPRSFCNNESFHATRAPEPSDEMPRRIAVAVYDAIQGLKGPWSVHPNQFLPAEVCCDYGGQMNLLKIMEDAIRAAMQQP